MDTLEYIKDKYKLDLEQPLPIKLPIERFKEFPKLMRELGFTKGVEIGVATGRYSKWLCHQMPKLKLFLVDPWEAYSDYVEHHYSSDVLNGCYEQAKERLANYNVEFIRKYSMDAVKDFLDDSLDFVFIDGNHSFEYVTEDIAAWSKKVKPGGIIAGHDYWNSINLKKYWATIENEDQRRKLCQVKYVVDAWTKANDIHPWFRLKDPVWFWIKK